MPRALDRCRPTEPWPRRRRQLTTTHTLASPWLIPPTGSKFSGSPEFDSTLSETLRQARSKARTPPMFTWRTRCVAPPLVDIVGHHSQIRAGKETSMAKPLAGIKVIELANFIAGPLCGTLLADMGADVIKVEPPKGDMSRATPPIRNGESVSFVALNRNKRSLVLNLKRPEAIEILLKLAAQSDVFVEAYRPGALEKLGLGAAHVKAVNPRIVYSSVSGFGQSGPYRRRAGVNLIIEAFSGMLSVTGEPGKMPMRPGVQTADVF